MRKPVGRQTVYGVTLIEILVVVALVALLVPASPSVWPCWSPLALLLSAALL